MGSRQMQQSRLSNDKSMSLRLSPPVAVDPIDNSSGSSSSLSVDRIKIKWNQSIEFQDYDNRNVVMNLG